MFLHAYPAHTIADVYAMPWYRFQLFLGRALSPTPLEYAPLHNAADEATEQVIRMDRWRQRMEARRQSR